MKYLNLLLLVVIVTTSFESVAGRTTSFHQEKNNKGTKINAGGKKIKTSTGDFSKDQHYSLLSLPLSTNKAIAGTLDDALYQTQRIGLKILSYRLPLQNGNYKIILHFAEIDRVKKGERVFDIFIEGKKVSDNFDIAAKAGLLTATSQTFILKVTNHVLDISLSALAKDGGKGNPVISAIEVIDIPVVKPPIVVTPIPDLAATEGVLFSYAIPAGTFSDPNNDSLSYTATLSNGSPLPSWLTFNSNLEFRGTPSAGNLPLSIKVTAINSNNASASSVFQLKLNRIPKALYGNTILVLDTMQENVSYSYTIPDSLFVDPDGDLLTYELYSSEVYPGRTGAFELLIEIGWMKYNQSTRTFSGTPPMRLPFTKNYLVTHTLRVSDDKGGFVETHFKFPGKMINDPPSTSGIQNDTMGKGRTFTKNIVIGEHFSDTDLKHIRYELSPEITLADGKRIPPWVQWRNFVLERFYLIGTPPIDGPDSLVFKFKVTDSGGASISTNFVWYFTEFVNNNPYVIHPIPDIYLDVNERFNIPSPFADPDGDYLTYSATQTNGAPIPSWMSLSEGTLYFTPPSDSPSQVDIRVNAHDEFGGTGYYEVTLFITKPSVLLSQNNLVEEGNSADKGNLVLKTYPNPIINTLNLKVESTEKDLYTVGVQDLAGNQLFHKEYMLSDEDLVTIDFEREGIAESKVFLVSVENRSKSFKKVIRVLKH